jgi:prepilin-type N-terminal cleavage/methylation domain-containing protein
MSRGTTLLELLLAVVITGILAALAAPAAGALRDHLLVSEAAALVAGAHARARLLASVERRVMVLTFTADSLVLRAVESPADTTERWRAAGPATAGILVSGFPRSVTFAPSGVAFGFSNGTYRFTRGTAQAQVIVSRYGRVRRQ